MHCTPQSEYAVPSRGKSAFSTEFGLPSVQQQVANAAVQSHFEIAVRDPVKHGDNMSVSAYTSLQSWQDALTSSCTCTL